jgi:hypothetical protein
MNNNNYKHESASKNDLILASVIPPDEPINGFKQNDLGDIWWQTLLSIPRDKNPTEFDDESDPQGVIGSSQKASLTRIDSIQFLAAAVTQTDELPFTATAERTIKVPGGTVFFLPILSGTNPDPYIKNGKLAGGIGGFDKDGNRITEESASEELAKLIDTITYLGVTIDGVSILESDLPPKNGNSEYRQQSDQPFFYNLPKDNILIEFGPGVTPLGETFGGVVGDGYWMGIGNLSPEQHEIRFQGGLPGFQLDITYNISFDLNPINGTNGQDYLMGTDGWDEINGLNRNDYIIGGKGNDALYGGRGSDTLIGVNPNFLNFLNPGQGEIDILNGGEGRDTFVLGDANNVYYTGQGLQDYAIIKDFNKNQDTIQLHGNRRSYELSETYSLGGKSGTSIFLKDNHELIGFVEGVTNLSLASNDFSFVCHY